MTAMTIDGKYAIPSYQIQFLAQSAVYLLYIVCNVTTKKHFRDTHTYLHLDKQLCHTQSMPDRL